MVSTGGGCTIGLLVFAVHLQIRVLAHDIDKVALEGEERAYQSEEDVARIDVEELTVVLGLIEARLRTLLIHLLRHHIARCAR